MTIARQTWDRRTRLLLDQVQRGGVQGDVGGRELAVAGVVRDGGRVGCIVDIRCGRTAVRP